MRGPIGASLTTVVWEHDSVAPFFAELLAKNLELDVNLSKNGLDHLLTYLEDPRLVSARCSAAEHQSSGLIAVTRSSRLSLGAWVGQ